MSNDVKQMSYDDFNPYDINHVANLDFYISKFKNEQLTGMIKKSSCLVGMYSHTNKRDEFKKEIDKHSMFVEKAEREILLRSGIMEPKKMTNEELLDYWWNAELVLSESGTEKKEEEQARAELLSRLSLYEAMVNNAGKDGD